MAGYVFELMSQADAATFTATDTLTFSTGSASQVRAVQTGGTATDSAFPGIALTLGTRTLTFPSGSLSAASRTDNVQFSDNSRLILGTGNDDPSATLQGTATRMDAIFGFEGNDTIGSSTASTSRSDAGDYIHGGIGNDFLFGGGGNDHIWGNSIGNDRPNSRDDGADSIFGGLGGDYLQGNQGNDTIDGGADSDRILGGQGDDVLRGGTAATVTGGTDAAPTSSQGGAFGADDINGNLGNDTIDGGDGNDNLRGGQGNDSVFGGQQDDIIYGDAGSDTIRGGTGQDVLFGDNPDNPGNRGGDQFRFEVSSVPSGDSLNSSINVSDAIFRESGQDANITDMIMDFQLNVDQIRIFGAPATSGGAGTVRNDIVRGENDPNFTDLFAASTYAQGLLNDGAGGNDPTTDVAVVSLNGSAMLFYSSTGDGTIDSAIRLTGIRSADVTEQSIGLIEGTGGGTTPTTPQPSGPGF